MDIHKNARLTPLGRERLVKMVLGGQTPQAVSAAVGVCPRTVRKWLERTHVQLLVLVDEGPYLVRMERSVGAERVGERRELWRSFVAARGLETCFADLREPTGESARRLRATLWQPAVDA